MRKCHSCQAFTMHRYFLCVALREILMHAATAIPCHPQNYGPQLQFCFFYFVVLSLNVSVFVVASSVRCVFLSFTLFCVILCVCVCLFLNVAVTYKLELHPVSNCRHHRCCIDTRICKRCAFIMVLAGVSLVCLKFENQHKQKHVADLQATIKKNFTNIVL